MKKRSLPSIVFVLGKPYEIKFKGILPAGQILVFASCIELSEDETPDDLEVALLEGLIAALEIEGFLKGGIPKTARHTLARAIVQAGFTLES